MCIDNWLIRKIIRMEMVLKKVLDTPNFSIYNLFVYFYY